MTIPDIIRRSARSLKSAKARTLLTAFAISVGTFALTLTLAASNGAQNFVDGVIEDNFDPAEIIVANDEAIISGSTSTEPQKYDDDFATSASQAGATIQVKQLNSNDIEKLKDIKGVEFVRENIELNFRYITRKGEAKYIATAQALSPAQKLDLLAGERKEPYIDEETIILPKAYLESLGFDKAKDAVGETVTLALPKPLDEDEIVKMFAMGATQEDVLEKTQKSLEKRRFEIAGIMNEPSAAQPGTELYLFMNPTDIKQLNNLSKKGSDDYKKYNFAFVRAKDGENEDKLNAVKDRIQDAGYEAQTVKEAQEFLTQIIDILEGIVAAFGFIAVIASVFGIINTMYISVIQRTREIGLMKALGMKGRDIGRLFRFEAALIGLLGGVLGAGGALITGALLNPYINETIGLDAGDELLRFDYNQIIVLILILIVISIIAGWLPSRKATKLDPIVALRTE